MNMQDVTLNREAGYKRVECKSCGTCSSSMWENHKILLVCFEEVN